MEIKWLRIEDVKPYANNAKLHDKTQIENVAESIKQFGWQQPIVVDSDGVIIVGHCRYSAAKKLKLKEVPCIVADGLTDEQVKKYRLLDNKTNESDWDLGLLSDDLEGLDFSGFDVEWGIVGEEQETEAVEDDFEIEVPEEPKAKLGQIYQLGRHRLMCGDSTKTEDVERLMDGEKAELTFTDPPYQLDTKGGGILKNANSMKQIKDNGVDSFDPAALHLYSETNVYCHNKPLIKAYIELAERERLAYDLCFYKKECTVPNYKGHMMTDCEYIAVIGKQDPNKGFPKEMYSKCYAGKKDADNELSYSKPIGLCAKYISLYSKEKVLDLFGGSGSTLIACEQLNRTCYMMELSPAYVDVIVKRWENFTGKKAVLISE